jgi:hypothetical protein
MKHNIMKAHRGVDIQIHVVLTSALVGHEWSASRPARFTPVEIWSTMNNEFEIKWKEVAVA